MSELTITFTKAPRNSRITVGKSYQLNSSSYFIDDSGNERKSPLPYDSSRGSWSKTDFNWTFINFKHYLHEVEMC